MNIIKLQNAILIKKYFSSEELFAFISNQASKELHISGVYGFGVGRIDTKQRNSSQVNVNASNLFINKLRMAVKSVNEDSFKVGISTYCKENNYVEYNIDGKFEKHKDTIWPKTVFEHDINPVRKLTTVVLLNNTFEGGKLALWNDASRYSFVFEPGDVITFPSYIMHKVDPVTTGMRCTVVSWSYGEF